MENAEETEFSSVRDSPGNYSVSHNPVMYPVEISVRLDWKTLGTLDKIALFEREKRATMARRIIIEKVQVYERNPAFKRFLKELEAQKAKDKVRKQRQKTDR